MVGKPSLDFKREGLVFSIPEREAGARSQLCVCVGGEGGSQEGDGVSRRHGPPSLLSLLTVSCFLPVAVCSSHPLFFLSSLSSFLTLPSALPYC